jgi:hypothetical protein
VVIKAWSANIGSSFKVRGSFAVSAVDGHYIAPNDEKIVINVKWVSMWEATGSD